MYRLKPFVVYLNGLESIGQILMLQGNPEDHFEIKLIARLLDQMHVVQSPVFLLRYDDAPPSAPQFPEHLHSLLTRS